MQRVVKRSVFALMLIGPFILLASVNNGLANDVRCVQAFLDFKGYDPGPIDGAFGGKTAAAAGAFADDIGAQIGPLTRETATDWCRFAIADPGFFSLVGGEDGPEGLHENGVRGNRDFNQILLGDSVGQYVPAERNVRNTNALGLIELDGGQVAARISVQYEDEGHRDDWYWNDRPGVQQRFELAEKQGFSMRPDRTYWHRMSVFITEETSVGNRDQLVLSDLKPRVGRRVFDPVLNIKLGDTYFQIDHLIGRPHECVHGFSEGGHENTLCDSSKEQLFVMPLAEAKGRWLNLVYRFHWANDETGSFHLWINDDLAVLLRGNSLHGADYILNKFGIYRGFYGTQGTPQPEANVYFAGVGRAGSCEELLLSNCAQFESDLGRTDPPANLGTNYVNETSMTDYLEAGGRVMGE